MGQMPSRLYVMAATVWSFIEHLVVRGLLLALFPRRDDEFLADLEEWFENTVFDSIPLYMSSCPGQSPRQTFSPSEGVALGNLLIEDMPSTRDFYSVNLFLEVLALGSSIILRK